MKRTTVRAVNKALQAEGIRAEFVRGRGYHYFVGEDVDYCTSTSVYVFHTSAYTVEEWIEQARAMVREHKRSAAQ